LTPPVPAGVTLDITSDKFPLVSLPIAALQPQTLAPGLYKATLGATGRSTLFEVTGAAPKTVTL
jgi:hypothetical protein